MILKDWSYLVTPYKTQLSDTIPYHHRLPPLALKMMRLSWYQVKNVASSSIEKIVLVCVVLAIRKSHEF